MTLPQKKPERKFKRPNVVLRQKRVLDNLMANGGKMTKAIRDAGYSKTVVHNPNKITNSVTWRQLLEDYLPDQELTQKHKELLSSTRIDHMVFGLGAKKTLEKKDGDDSLSDEEIIELLAEVDCKVRKITHNEHARHVYFWSSDNRSRKDALDMAYKLKGRYGDDDTIRNNTNATYNFIFSNEVQDKIKVIDSEIKELLTKPKDDKQI